MRTEDTQQPYIRLLIFSLVVLVHVLLFWFWLVMPKATIPVPDEMSVSISVPPPERSEAKSVPDKPAFRSVANAAVAPPVAVPVVTAAPTVQAPPPAQTASPTIPTAPLIVSDTEPDYKAGYLSNPRPAYPMVARRMGWQGRVILNVEVLAEGASGTVVVFHSSGHEVLDNAAMNTVKGWRFTPARHGGRAVTQWFKVPIVFSLEDNEA